MSSNYFRQDARNTRCIQRSRVESRRPDVIPLPRLLQPSPSFVLLADYSLFSIQWPKRERAITEEDGREKLRKGLELRSRNPIFSSIEVSSSQLLLLITFDEPLNPRARSQSRGSTNCSFDN